MRRVILVPAFILGSLPAVAAEPPASIRTETRTRPETIRVAEAEVRAGPSSQYPVTGILRRGAQIWVKADAQNDFLKIVPPPGSVSWVPKAVVAPFGPLSGGRQAFRIVGGDDESIPVLPGSLETNGPLEVKDPELKINRGAQGYLRGAPVKPSWDIRQWVPIDPMSGESRFIVKSAIQDGAPAPQSAASAKSPLTDSSLAGLSGLELYKRAEQAERDGNIDVAIDLFNRVTKQESARNFDLANRAATKVFELSRSRPTRPAPGSLVSRSGDGNAVGSSAPPQGASLKPNMPVAPNNAQRSSGVGWLRKTGFQIDDKPSYALIDGNRRIMYYVTGEPGVNLSPYLERWVELFGVTEVRGDIRGADYMRVSRVSLVR